MPFKNEEQSYSLNYVLVPLDICFDFELNDKLCL